MASTDSIRALARPPLASAGLQLWDVEVTADSIRIFVDRDGGVDLDTLSDASRVLSELLDLNDAIAPPGGYQLEVSSPGLERVLRTPEQHRRYQGATVTVKTAVAVEGARRHRGVLVGADETGILLARDTVPGGPPLAIAYDQIQRTRTVLDWEPAPKPGSRPKTSGLPRTTGRRSETPGPSPAAVSGTGAAQDSKDRAR